MTATNTNTDTDTDARSERHIPEPAPTRTGLILGAYFTGRERVAWQHPDTGDLLDIATIVENAQIADRAGFQLHFLAEGLSLREERGGIAWHSVNGRHDVATLHAIIAGTTEQIGLMSTISSSFYEPFDVARKLATIDVLSGGRAGWNVVTAQSVTSSANFGHRASLPYEERYARASDAIGAVQHLWRGGSAEHDHRGEYTRLSAATAWPAPPQGSGPVLFTASGSDAGADFAAGHADGVFILPQDFDHAVRLTARLSERLKAHGRHRNELRVISGRDIVLGDTDAEARERFSSFTDLELTDEDVRLELEQVWQQDLSNLDPDGALPAEDPDLERLQRHLSTAPGVEFRDAREHLAHWRGLAEREGLTNRELVKRRILRPAFVGSPATVADEIERWWSAGAVDGFIVQPHVVPGGLREFAERVVPILQERGIFRTEAPRQSFRDALRYV